MAKKRSGCLPVIGVSLALVAGVGGAAYFRSEGEKSDKAQSELANWLQQKGAPAAVGGLATNKCVAVNLPVFGLGEYHKSALGGNQNSHQPEDVDIFVATNDGRTAAVYDYRFGEGEQGTVRLGLGAPESEAAGAAAVAAQVCRTGGNGDRTASFEVRMPRTVSADWVVLRMAQLPPPAPSPSGTPR